VLLIALAIAASLVTIFLLWALLRSLRDRETQPPPPQAQHQERRRTHTPARDAREAIALVGDALAATHNPRALVPLILEVVTEATGARGAQMVQDGEEVGWFGDVGGKGRPLTLELRSESTDINASLVLYPQGRSFDRETLKLAEWIAAQAGIAFENARLHDEVRRQATTDELTSLVNRRRFIEALEIELERAKMFGTPLTVVLADLDDFKRINDSYGHHAGDHALRAFGELLRNHVRDVDVAGRIGGEEFAICLPETGLEAAAAVAARMRGALASSRITLPEGAQIRLTASFGIAESVAGESTDELLRQADAALYEAKRAGKNRFTLAQRADAQ
jgi:diguanylate cyclase (GGDEF)-like protein